MPFWLHFGCQNRPKSGQVRSKMALEAIFFEKSEFSRKALKTNEKSTKMTPRAVTKRPKIVPKRCQDDLEEVFFALRFLHRFLVVFWSDFGVILEAFGRLWGVQIGHFWHRFFDDFCMSFQERPKSGQERPKRDQGRHKSGQGRPKGGQEQPKSAPRAAKSGPRRFVL